MKKTVLAAVALIMAVSVLWADDDFKKIDRDIEDSLKMMLLPSFEIEPPTTLPEAFRAFQERVGAESKKHANLPHDLSNLKFEIELAEKDRENPPVVKRYFYLKPISVFYSFSRVCDALHYRLKVDKGDVKVVPRDPRGWKPPKEEVETKAFQMEINRLAANGGGTLVVKPGVHIVGALFFRPGVNLHLEKDAVLRGSDERGDYPLIETRIEGESCLYFPAIVNAIRCDGFRITGEGVVDGHGLATWRHFWELRSKKGKDFRGTDMEMVRPRNLYVAHSKDIDIGGVTFKNSKFWTTHFYKCENVRVHDCEMVSEVIEGVRGPSTDAIDIDACNGFVVSNVVMNVNDDAVVLKGGGRTPNADDPVLCPGNGTTENVLVEDCTFKGSCHSSLTLGSECIHARNVTMRNCRIHGAHKLLYLKMRYETPQLYENVLVENCTGWTKFYFDGGVFGHPMGGTTEFPPSIASNVVMRANKVGCKRFRRFSNQPFATFIDVKIEK